MLPKPPSVIGLTPLGTCVTLQKRKGTEKRSKGGCSCSWVSRYRQEEDSRGKLQVWRDTSLHPHPGKMSIQARESGGARMGVGKGADREGGEPSALWNSAAPEKCPVLPRGAVR